MNLLIATVVRLVMIIAGMFLGSNPDEVVVDEKNVEIITGAVLVILAGAWGIWEKIRLKKGGIDTAKDAERRAVPRSEDPADEVVQSKLREQARRGE